MSVRRDEERELLITLFNTTMLPKETRL